MDRRPAACFFRYESIRLYQRPLKERIFGLVFGGGFEILYGGLTV